MGTLLISCYDLGRQPLDVAVRKAQLERQGETVETLDLSVEQFDESRVRRAERVEISVPMHTALRIGARVADRVRETNPAAPVKFRGLYAALLGLGEGESAEAIAPSRDGMPPLDRYAKLEIDGEERLAGAVEASRGCKHLCRHCPIPPVYGGRFVPIPLDVVMQDIRRLAAMGAEHISFTDPDFLNGPGHAMRVVEAMRAVFPRVTFDFTAKIEHIVKRPHLVRELAPLFITSAVESLSERVLAILDKGHTRRDVERALETCRTAGVTLRPTWLPFTPWTTCQDYADIVRFIAEEGLVECVDPVQLALRLLVPPGSLLLDRPEMKPHLRGRNDAMFTYEWEHPDPAMDALQRRVAAIAAADPHGSFAVIAGEAGVEVEIGPARRRPPRMTESWYC